MLIGKNLNAKPGPRVISHQLGASTGFSILVTRTFLSLQSRPVSYFFWSSWVVGLLMYVSRYQRKSLRLWGGGKRLVIFKCWRKGFLKGFLHLELHLKVYCFERSVETRHAFHFERLYLLHSSGSRAHKSIVHVCVCVQTLNSFYLFFKQVDY